MNANVEPITEARPSDPDWLPLRLALRDAAEAIERIRRIATRRGDARAWQLADQHEAAMRSALAEFDAAEATDDEAAPCLVYVIRRASTNEVKIGISRNVAKRLAALQGASGEPLDLLHTAPGGRSLELTLHRRFAAHRKHGEWFSYADDVRAWVEGTPREVPQPAPQEAGSNGRLSYTVIQEPTDRKFPGLAEVKESSGDARVRQNRRYRAVGVVSLELPQRVPQP